MVNSFVDCVITHNYRETNKVADQVDNVACKIHEKVIWNNYNDISIDGKSLIDLDRLKSRQVLNHDFNAYEDQLWNMFDLRSTEGDQL